MVCKKEDGTLRPVPIHNGRSLLDTQVLRSGMARKDLVVEIRAARAEHEATEKKVKLLRSSLAATIPTDDIIVQRQERDKIEAEMKILSAEKSVLDSALQNLDFKRAESDVFYSSERVLQQYLEEEQNQHNPGASNNRKPIPKKK